MTYGGTNSYLSCMLRNIRRLTAMLAELNPSNQTLAEYASYAVQFYEQALARFTPQQGCLQQQILLSENGSPVCDVNHTSVDCSTWFAGGLSVLANVTNNATMLEL
jgi:hypothetical protein